MRCACAVAVWCHASRPVLTRVVPRSTRDEWMKEDLAGWLAANRFYNGWPEALRAVMAKPELDMYIVTTKQARVERRAESRLLRQQLTRALSACAQARFTQTLLRDLGGVDLPMERIFSQARTPRVTQQRFIRC